MAIDEQKLRRDIEYFRCGRYHKTDIINALALSYTSKNLAEWIFDEALKKAERGGEDTKIIITLSEFKQLLSNFKIKGVRGFMPNGEIIYENRGAKDNRPENPFEL